MVAIEIDGWRYHSSRDQLRRDHRRINGLIEAGWTVVLVSFDDLKQPADLLERLSRLLGIERLRV